MLRWKQFCQDKLLGARPGGSLTLEHFSSRLDELEQSNLTTADAGIISDLKAYAKMLCD